MPATHYNITITNAENRPPEHFVCAASDIDAVLGYLTRNGGWAPGHSSLGRRVWIREDSFAVIIASPSKLLAGATPRAVQESA